MFLEEIKRVFIHIRWPLQVYTLQGFLFGLVIAKIRFGLNTVLAFVAWFLLWVGVTLLNSYYDKDDKPVAGLRNPPRISVSLLYGSLLFKLTSLILSFFVSLTFLFFTVLIIVLSFLYSHRLFRLKANGFVALIFNFIAGFVTFLAAASLGGHLLENTVLLGAFSAGLLLMAVYLIMQVHQVKDDKKRGDISYTLIFGRHCALITAVFLLIPAGVCGFFAFYLSSLILPLVILGVYVILGMFLILHWIKSPRTKDFDIMTRVTNYFSFIGFLIFLVLYFLSL